MNHTAEAVVSNKFSHSLYRSRFRNGHQQDLTFMRIEIKKLAASLLLTLTTTSAIATGKVQRANNEATPSVFLLDARQVQLTRQRIRDSDKSLTAAWARLQREAQKALSEGPFSIVNKSVTPRSGDKHDYMTQAPYFWPDPKSPNGLPYIRRDGERNPEINKITDNRSLDQIEASDETLALAFYFKGDEAYAAKAVQLLRAFFLDPATRMNPNLQYAQFIPGVNTGRGIGLIETRGLTRVVDAIGLLAGSETLTGAHQRGLQGWFCKILAWLQGSKNSGAESTATNNHGTPYDQ